MPSKADCKGAMQIRSKELEVTPGSTTKIIAVGPLVLPIVPTALSMGQAQTDLSFRVQVDRSAQISETFLKELRDKNNWTLEISELPIKAISVASATIPNGFIISFEFPEQIVRDIDLKFASAQLGTSIITFRQERVLGFSALALYPLAPSPCAH